MTWLDYYLDSADPPMSGSELARRVGTNRQNISDLRAGKAAMSQKWAERIAPLLKVKPSELIFGPGGSIADLTVLEVPVRGTVAAGRWLEHEKADLDLTGDYQVPALPSGYGRPSDQFAYKVEGLSMDKRRILPGDFVVCVPYYVARAAPTSGDIVVIERTRGQLVERTVKELRIKDDTISFISHSSDHRYNEPLMCAHRGSLLQCDDGGVIEIVGYVVGRYAPM